MRHLRSCFASVGLLAIVAGACAPAFCAGIDAPALRRSAVEDGRTAATSPVTEPDGVAENAGERGVLSANDITLYSQIFELQDEGLWGRADALIAQLSDRVLMGHVLAERYLDAGAYRVKYAELAAWLSAYADHPQADDIYTLALKRHPHGAPWPNKPLHVQMKSSWEGEPDLIPTRDNASARRKVAAIQKSVKRLVGQGRPSAALKILDAPKAQKELTPNESDEIRLWIAASFYYTHNDDQAYSIAHDIAERQRGILSMADWIAGLASWRLGKPETSARHFEELANSATVSPGVRPAAAYWAARANLVAGVPERVTKDLRLAAKSPSTFYGLLALRQLGETPKFTWSMPAVTPDEIVKALSVPSVKRAVALAQVGENERADLEMRRAHAITPSSLDRALIVLSADYQLASAQLHVAETSGLPGLDGALYPVPVYKPQNGFTIDPALLYAFMRQESRFKPAAKSHAGAQGLMQIMPATAALVAHDRTLKKRNKTKLYDASYNLRLAQTYIEQLLTYTQPKGNLFMLAVAYNGGPGNLRKWFKGMAIQDDPLLFIESVPSRESRSYVEHVLANLWIYRYRLNEPDPSLDMVASGTWPVYDQHAAEGPHAAAGGPTMALERP